MKNDSKTYDFLSWYFDNEFKNDTIHLYYKNDKEWNMASEPDTTSNSLDKKEYNIFTYNFLDEKKDIYYNILKTSLDSIFKLKKSTEFLIKQNDEDFIIDFKMINTNKILMKNMEKYGDISWFISHKEKYSISRPMFTRDGKYCFIATRVIQSYESSNGINIYRLIDKSKWEFVGHFELFN